MAATQRADVVTLADVPVRLFLDSQDHQHDLIRELQLIRIGGRLDDATSEMSQRLASLISQVLAVYADVRTSTREQALAALARGEDVVTLRVPIYPGMADALRHWLALLEEADALCRHGELLLLATTPDIRQLRRWYVEQLTSRI